MMNFDLKIVIVILVLLNFVFMEAIWHMSHNFVLKEKPAEKTKGMLKIDREDAYRFSEYCALITFLLMDGLFIFMFVK